MPEFFFMLILWAIPIALAAFVIGSLWQITRSMGSIERELASIRQLLERDRTPS